MKGDSVLVSKTTLKVIGVLAFIAISLALIAGCQGGTSSPQAGGTNSDSASGTAVAAGPKVMFFSAEW